MSFYQSLPLPAVRLQDEVFAPRIRTGIERTLPGAIAHCRETGRLDMFSLQWRPGMPNRPHVYWTSDVAKVLEGMAMDYELTRSPELGRQLEELVELIVSAQEPDGYLNPPFTLLNPQDRWKNLFNGHELYCAGHLMEAAVAHFQATGHRNFLDAACRFADLIDREFGPDPAQRHGYPGHEEIELALCKLADAAGKPRYRKLAAYFIDERGREPNYFLQENEAFPTEASPDQLINRQAHRPVRKQTEAVGHAVRALYLYSGMVDCADAAGDAELLECCRKLFENIENRRMYLTGGVGSAARGECFTMDYDLPNDTAYAESCAAIALVFFADRMLRHTGDAHYAEVLEKCLYNGTLSGLSLSGDRFFYGNLLEVSESTATSGHQCRERQPWFDCSCCPTSFCRFLPQLGRFCFLAGNSEAALIIPAAGHVVCTPAEAPVAFDISGRYPYEPDVTVTVRGSGCFTFSIRLPEWCPEVKIQLNDSPVSGHMERGFCKIERNWHPGDRLSLHYAMPVRLLRSHPAVTANAGRGAITRGPLVYALESIDNGLRPSQLVLAQDPDFRLIPAPDGLPPGTVAISARARREVRTASRRLYESETISSEPVRIIAVPYALWQNRGPAEMQVWIRCDD